MRVLRLCICCLCVCYVSCLGQCVSHAPSTKGQKILTVSAYNVSINQWDTVGNMIVEATSPSVAAYGNMVVVSGGLYVYDMHTHTHTLTHRLMLGGTYTCCRDNADSASDQIIIFRYAGNAWQTPTQFQGTGAGFSARYGHYTALVPSPSVWSVTHTRTHCRRDRTSTCIIMYGV